MKGLEGNRPIVDSFLLPKHRPTWKAWYGGAFVDYKLDARCAGKKTAIWNVETSREGLRLGEVRWYAPWRRYVFIPIARRLTEAHFDASCLKELSDFVGARTKEHFARLKARRAAQG